MKVTEVSIDKVILAEKIKNKRGFHGLIRSLIKRNRISV